MKKILLYISFCLTLFLSCTEEYIGQPSVDGTKPNTVTGVTVKNIPGGAIVHYKVPGDNNLLYVKGVYMINGKECNTSASIYTDSLTIEGFGSAEKQIIQLYCVDRNNNVSDPVSVEINPDIPPIRSIGETFDMSVAFGGVTLKWKNDSKSMMAFYFLAENLQTKEMEVADIVYSNSKDGKYTLRGFDTQERDFWCVARDRWNNYSDTIKGRFAPYYEIQVSGKNIKRVKLPGDNQTDNGDWWAFQKMFDGLIYESGGWHTYEPKAPIMFTIDLGAPTKLSRYIWWHCDPYLSHYNAKKWKMYGLKTPEELDRLQSQHPNDEDYWTSGFEKDWIKIMDCEAIPQSGSTQPTADDKTWVKNNGLEFEVPLTTEPVRYLRFWVTETWGSGAKCNMLMVAELQFFGDIQK